MRFILVIFFLFTSCHAFADAVIFSGADVKTLKYNVDLFGRMKFMALAADPSSGGGQAAPLSSIGTNYLTGLVYIKTGAGNTDWTRVSVASDLTAYIPKSTLTAKGDILVATGSTTPSVRAVGTNGYVLQADSTHATGLSYKETSDAAAASSLVLLDANKDLAARRIETSAGVDALDIDNRQMLNTGGALIYDYSGGYGVEYQGVGIGNPSLAPVIRINSATTGGAYTMTLPAGAGSSGSIISSSVSGSTSTLSFTQTPVLGVAGTALGSIGLSGNTSGVVTIRPAAAAGTYDFYLPTSMGSSGQVLTSAGAGAAPTWTTPFSNPMTTAGDLIYGGTSGSPTRLAIGTASPSQFLGVNDSATAPQWRSFSAMTVQTFTSGSGTYNRPANVVYLEVTMIGGGGGGQGSGSASRGSGGTGGDTTFSTATAGGGTGGSDATSAGGGGTSGCTVGILGGNATGSYTAAGSSKGVNGASSSVGGGGPGGVAGGAGVVGATNTGGGGGGGGVTSAINVGGGGGSGATCIFRIASPSATYSYAVGSGGSAGSAGTGGSGGGAGAAGLIIVREYYP